MEPLIHYAPYTGWVYPNETVIEWSVAIVVYPDITGLVAGEGAHPLALDLLSDAESRELLCGGRAVTSGKIADCFPVLIVDSITIPLEL